MLTVGQLLETPHLRLSLLAGSQGLDRQVAWVHISDLPNPWEWLGDEELLLTNGLNLPLDGDAQVAFLDTLHSVGASALAVGSEGMPSPALSKELQRRADELELAILLVPYSVPFSAIVRAAADANATEEAQRLARVARVYELLRLAVARGQPRRTIINRLEEEMHCRFHLVDPGLGRPLFRQDENTSFARQLVEAYAEHAGMLPGVLHLQDGATRAMAVSIPGEQPAALLATSDERLPELELLQHVATVGALEVAGLRARREKRRRQGAELLARLLDNGLEDDSAHRRLSEFGLAADTALILALKRQELDDSDESLHHQLARHELPHLLLKRESSLFVMTSSTPAWMNETLSILKADNYVVGVSASIRTVQTIPNAAREAQWALGVAETDGRRVVYYTNEQTLLVPRTLEEGQVIVEEVLGSVIAYDTTHGSELLHTLRTILQADGSWHAAARTLHVHKQTLGYRLRKIEKLAGRSTKTSRGTAELWFAMRAYDLIHGRSPADASRLPNH